MTQPEVNTVGQTIQEQEAQRDDYAMAGLACLALTAFAGVDLITGNVSGLHAVADITGLSIGTVGARDFVPKAIRMHFSLRNRINSQ